MKVYPPEKAEYNGVKIYILQFGYIFQWIAQIDGEMHMNFTYFPPALWRRVLFFFGLLKDPYDTKAQQAAHIKQSCIQDALKVIDGIRNGMVSKPVPNEAPDEASNEAKKV